MKIKHIIASLVVVCMIIAAMPLSFAADYNTKQHSIHVYYMGDVTLDDIVNTGDATLILKACANQLTLTEEQTERQDANMDGEFNTGDATYVLRIAAEMATVHEITKDEPDEYTVHYDLGEIPEGTSIMVPDDVKVPEGTEYTVNQQAENFQTEDMTYTFKGWSMTEGENTHIYATGETFTMPSHDVTLTAVWETEEIAVDGEVTITIEVYDAFNGTAVSETAEMKANVGDVVNEKNVVMPEGYKPMKKFSVTVTDTTTSIKVDAYPYAATDEGEFTLINTMAGFDKINDNLSLNYMLGNDIDCGNKKRMPFGWPWNDLTQDDIAFTGIFDGNGYTITGLYIDYTNNYAQVYNPYGETNYDYYSNVGLFAVNEGIVRNVSVYTRLYDGTSLEYGVFGDVNVGIIVGQNTAKGKVINCHAFGNVGSLDYIEMSRGGAGGVVGSNSGLVERCSMDGGVEGFYWIGGIVGKNFGTISQSYFAGGINSQCDDDTAEEAQIRYVGGIAGGMQDGTIKDTYTYLHNDILAYCAIGGMLGWCKGGTLENVLVLNAGNIVYWDPDSVASDIGYMVSAPKYSGLGTVAGVEVNGGVLPEMFSEEIWDMNGACLPKCPDLIKNRRPEVLFVDIED